ncbi:phosphatidylethanolamine-binding protein [Moniliophthora roreri]|nr:phosphatidylethanolamine-binding protein [Moniliophthora roreri]
MQLGSRFHEKNQPVLLDEEERTTQCLNSLNFGSARDGASGSIITNVYVVSPLSLVESPAASSLGTIGVKLISGSLSASSLGRSLRE